MARKTRREFLSDVGQGMLMASVGSTLANDLGLATMALADEGAKPLAFGALEPLVALMQETPIERLLPEVVRRMRDGTDAKQIVAAAALANARTFGGQDYEGYHTIMALSPAYQMARELDTPRQALPILKVLYRNTNHIQESGGRAHEALHPVESEPLASTNQPAGEVLRDLVRKQDMEGAERTFATLANGSLDEAYNDLLYLVHDDVNVHRVVLAWRAWALLDLTGKEQAHTLLRQSVRFCVDGEREIQKRGGNAELRGLLPKLLDQHKLVEREPGRKEAEDAWVDQLCETIVTSSRSQAADAVAAALAEGFSHEAVGEAISLAANQLVLRDPGRRQADSSAKPVGSVHGASVGVHASDSANAWRNIARVSNRRNAVASLIVGAYHTAGQNQFLNKQPYPLAEHESRASSHQPGAMLGDVEAAIKAKDQALACALVHRMGELGEAPRPVFDLLIRYAISEDGALHAEKYYRTVSEEFASTRPSFRWRHLAALARVTASEYGFPAPGYDQAKELLKG